MNGEPTDGEASFEVAVVRPDPLTVTVDGPLDFETAEELLETVGKALAEHGGTRLLAVDVAGLTLCDSMGLSALLSIRRSTAAAGVRLRLLNRPGLLNRLMELTGTEEYLVGTPGDEAADDERARP